MDVIYKIFRGINIEYDMKNKIIIVNQAMTVDEFIYLKRLIRLANLHIKDIRLYSEPIKKARAWN